MPFDFRKALGAIPSAYDSRNFRVACTLPAVAASLPAAYDGLLPYHDLVNWYDQGQIGSCVGWSNKIAMELQHRLMTGVPSPPLSASFLYNESRGWSSGIDLNQEGSTNLGAMKAMNKVGVCPEDYCATDVGLPWEFHPSPNAWEVAKRRLVSSYYYISPTASDMQAAIYGLSHPAPYKMSDGSQGKIPLVVTIPVYSDMDVSFTNGGKVLTPKPGSWLEGYHATVFRGWKLVDGRPCFINTGSWGKDIGDKGTFYFDFTYPVYDAWLFTPAMPVLSPALPPVQYALNIYKGGKIPFGTTDKANGTTNPSAGVRYYNKGTSVTVTATPDSVSDFSYWDVRYGFESGGKGDGVITKTITVPMNGYVSLQPYYQKKIIVTPPPTPKPCALRTAISRLTRKI